MIEGVDLVCLEDVKYTYLVNYGKDISRKYAIKCFNS